MADRAESLPYPGLCPTGHEPGVQGRPADGHQFQSTRQVHKNKAGLRSSQDISPCVGPSRAELETSILSMSQGQALMAPGWAEMVLLGHREAPGEHRTISSVYIKQHCQLRAKQCTQRLSTWKAGRKWRTFLFILMLRIKEAVVVIIAIKKSQHKLSWVKSSQWMQLKGTVHSNLFCISGKQSRLSFRGFFHSNIFILFICIML